MKKIFILLVVVLQSMSLQSLYAAEIRLALNNLPNGTYNGFHDGMAVFRDDKTRLFGAINTNGEVVIHPKFKRMSDFVGGASLVETEEGKGFINKKGVFLLPPNNTQRIEFVYHTDKSGKYTEVPGLYTIENAQKNEKGYWYNNRMVIPLQRDNKYSIDFPFVSWTDSVDMSTKVLSLVTNEIYTGKVMKKGQLRTLIINTPQGQISKYYDLFKEVEVIEKSSKGVWFSSPNGYSYDIIDAKGDTLLSHLEGWNIPLPIWTHDMVYAYKLDSDTKPQVQHMRLYNGQGKLCLDLSSTEEIFVGMISGNGFATTTFDQEWNSHNDLYNFKGKKVIEDARYLLNITDNWFDVFYEKGNKFYYNIATEKKYPYRIGNVSENMIVAKNDKDQCFIINLKTDMYKFIPNATDIYAYHEGLAIVETKDSKRFAIDKNGNTILKDCDQYELLSFSKSSEGVIYVYYNYGGNYAYIYNPLLPNTPIYGKDEHNEWLIKQGETFFNKKQYSKAKEYFYDVMINDPKNVIAITYYGTCLNNMGYYESAIDAIRTALKIDPNNEWASKNLKIAEDNLAQEKQWKEQQQNASNTVNWVDGLTQFLNILGDTFSEYAEFTNNMNTSRDSGSSYRSNSSSRSSSSTQSGSENTSRNRDSRTYSDLESQLIKMSTYPSTYNANQRKSIQSQMRSIRTKWESRGYRMFHSQWEDWNGF